MCQIQNMFLHFYLYIIIYATLSLKYGNELKIIKDLRHHPAQISIWYRKLLPHPWYLCSTDLQGEKTVAWEGTPSAWITILRIFFKNSGPNKSSHVYRPSESCFHLFSHKMQFCVPSQSGPCYIQVPVYQVWNVHISYGYD